MPNKWFPTLRQAAQVGLRLIQLILLAPALEHDGVSDVILQTPLGNLLSNHVNGVKATLLYKSIQKHGVGEGIQVKTVEPHSAELLECHLWFPCNGIVHDQRVVLSDLVNVPMGHIILQELFKRHRLELRFRKNLEDGMEGGSGVVEPRLAACPVEELEAGENVALRGGVAIGEDLEDKGLGESEVEVGQPGGCIVHGDLAMGV
ncbi:hypothetical protein QQP08_026687 [Theobroma cacao]|nr:hypothetical protein QQP08_026687 [Theobroma cacao]